MAGAVPSAETRKRLPFPAAGGGVVLARCIYKNVKRIETSRVELDRGQIASRLANLRGGAVGALLR